MIEYPRLVMSFQYAGGWDWWVMEDGGKVKLRFGRCDRQDDAIYAANLARASFLSTEDGIRECVQQLRIAGMVDAAKLLVEHAQRQNMRVY